MKTASSISHWQEKSYFFQLIRIRYIPAFRQTLLFQLFHGAETSVDLFALCSFLESSHFKETGLTFL